MTTKDAAKRELMLREASAMRSILEKKKKALGLNQKILSERYGVKPSSISNYLNPNDDKSMMLNAKFASFFAEQLQVPIEAFSPRIAKEIGEMSKTIDNKSFRYPLLKPSEIKNKNSIIKIFKNSPANRESLVTDIDAGSNGYWIELESEEIQTNIDLSFFKFMNLLINPDIAPEIGQYALIEVKYTNTKQMMKHLIMEEQQILFRKISSSGIILIAKASDSNFQDALKNEDITMFGTVLSALIPKSVFTP